MSLCSPPEVIQDIKITKSLGTSCFQRGFTLIELSIVLVVVGLLAGGVLTAQSLIRSSEVRSVTTEFQNFQNAIQIFRDTYFAIPGDMGNATAIWGAAPVCPGVAANAHTTAATCNGNKNGTVVHLGITAHEAYNFWQHLSNAGLIDGQYSGVTSSTVNYWDYGTVYGWNTPKGKLTPGGWYAQTTGTAAISSMHLVEGDYGNTLMFGAVSPDLPRNPALKPEEAWNIDTKIDDGQPGTGSLLIFEYSTGCFLLGDGVTAGSGSNAVARSDIVYNVKSNAVACALVFKNVF